MSGRSTSSLGRVPAAVFAAGIGLVLGSFFAARHAARDFFRNTVSFPGAVHMAVNWRRWRSPLRPPSAESSPLGPWTAWACATASCDFVATLQLSATGGVVSSTPSELARRLADESARSHAVLYVLLAPGDRVREALPPVRPEDASAPLWDAALPGRAAGDSGETISVSDRGEVTVLSLPDPWDLAAATERPPRLALVDAWLRERLAGRHILSGDAAILLEGLPPRRERRLVSAREGVRFLAWLDRQPLGTWRVVN